MPLPDYQGNSLVNLMSTLGQAMGVRINDYPALAGIEPDELAQYRNIVLFVVDGLGYEYLLNHGQGSALHQHLHSRLTSVFPSTTATAITTFMTGLAPQQHGLTGWFTYLKELGCVTAVLPFRARAGCKGLDSEGMDVHRLYGHTPLFDLLTRTGYVVAPEWIIHSAYNVAHSGSAFLHGYNTLQQCFANVADIVRNRQDAKYVYAYWPDFDRYSHDYGCEHKRVHAHFAELDGAFEQLLKAIKGSDTLLLVTADHGFIDTAASKVIHLSEHPVMQDAMLLPLCGEPRMAYCYVHPDKQAQFAAYVENELADFAELKDSRALVAEGYFGHGTPHPSLFDRIGHYALIMKENYILKDQLMGEPPFAHIGVHGGTSSKEMYVPLIIASG